MVRDALPLPQTDEAPHAVHSSNWFSTFDLTQWYLELAMEDDIKRVVFRSLYLCQFPHTPFGLSNAGSNFGHLMEPCLGVQQFFILLL